MSKKKKNVDGALNDFAAFTKSLSKINKNIGHGAVMAEADFTEPKEYIGVGHYLANALISGSLFGGVPDNKTIIFQGDTGTGKTYLCLNSVREAQKMGYNVYYIDTEGAITESQVKKFGIDPERMWIHNITTVSDCKAFIANLIEEVRAFREKGSEIKIALYIDSLGMLVTEKEYKNALDNHNASDMGLRAKELRSMIRVITLPLCELRIPLVMTNHIGIDTSGFKPQEVGSGGKALQYAASMVMHIYKTIFYAKDQKDAGVNDANKKDTERIGTKVRAKMIKARYTVPSEIVMFIHFSRGMNPYTGLEKILNWENSGIARGRMKWVDPNEPRTSKMLYSDVIKDGKLLAVEPSVQSNFFVSTFLQKEIPKAKYFSSEMFPEAFLRKIDEEVIRPMFEYSDTDDANELIDNEIINMEGENEDS